MCLHSRWASQNIYFSAYLTSTSTTSMDFFLRPPGSYFSCKKKSFVTQLNFSCCCSLCQIYKNFLNKSTIEIGSLKEWKIRNFSSTRFNGSHPNIEINDAKESINQNSTHNDSMGSSLFSFSLSLSRLLFMFFQLLLFHTKSRLSLFVKYMAIVEYYIEWMRKKGKNSKKQFSNSRELGIIMKAHIVK